MALTHTAPHMGLKPDFLVCLNGALSPRADQTPEIYTDLKSDSKTKSSKALRGTPGGPW